ncbi:anti-sigma factor [Hamadaea sp. NPDC051192]|uniref:anti-sigma factor n=1 Tax=Hamadaea sp. NPDC051192 TaxID=3154940 RepID=UPI0034414D1E
MSHDLLAAYALDAVDAAERGDVERHLGGCAECARELASFHRTLGEYAQGAEPVEPPASLRSAVLTAIGSTPQTAGVIRTPLRRRVRLVALVAGVAAAVAFGVLAVQQLWPSGARPSDAIAAVLAAPDAREQHTTVAGGGEITAVISDERAQAVVTVRGLPTSDTSHAYQLWIIRVNGQPESVDVLEPGDGDDVRLLDGIGDAIGYGVTREPPGGSAVPTLPMLAGVPLD